MLVITGDAKQHSPRDGGSPSVIRRMNRSQRQGELRNRLSQDPFLTDEELARQFGVSVQTIRLDRLGLGIPELRQRIRDMAQRSRGVVRALGTGEIVGELVDVELDRSGLSILETTPDMVFEKSRVVRSHYIFAQADSLALAIVDAQVAVTGLANVKYKRPVMAGERLVARAEVIRSREPDRQVVLVVTRASGDQVFRGKFVVSKLEN